MILLTGLFILTVGIALSVKADLGTSPISSVPYVLSLAIPVSMGMLFNILNIFFILLQIILLRKDYHWIQLLQLPVALVFGMFTDLAMYLLSANVHITGYLFQWAACLASILLIALGVYLQVKARLIYLAGEGLCLAVSKVFHVEFGKVKTGLDLSLVTIGIIASFVLLHRLEGVREGTIAAALLVGTTVRLYNRKIKFPDYILGPEPGKEKPVQFPPASEGKRTVVTIAREFGSGGHEIGLLVARKLGIPFYDKELIDLSAREGGLTADFVKTHEQKFKRSIISNLIEQNYAYVYNDRSDMDKLFDAQCRVIREISSGGSCVIVGRCADQVLRDDPACFPVYVHADRDFRIRRIIEEYGIPAGRAEKEMERIDRERNEYCRHYTREEWGKAVNYILTVDSSRFGIEGSAALITAALSERS